MRDAFGTASLRSSKRFALSSTDCHAGDVGSRPRETFDQADTIGITDEGQDDWYRRGGLLCRRRGRTARGHDDVDFESDELGGEPGEQLPLGVGPPGEIDDVLLLDIPEVPESLSQRQRGGAVRSSSATGQEPDPPCLARLLRARGERRREQRSKRDERGAPRDHRADEMVEAGRAELDRADAFEDDSVPLPGTKISSHPLN